MDIEISADGRTLYSTQTYFGDGAPPTKSYFFYARKKGDMFVVQENSEHIFKTINATGIVYAATISRDEKEIMFTRLMPGLRFQSLYAKRSHKDLPFGQPQIIDSINGYAEAPAYNQDETKIYYHKQTENTGLFDIYVLHKK